MSQVFLYSFDVISGMNRGNSVGVAGIMEPNVFCADGLEDFVMGVSERVWIVHGSGFRRGEHIRISGMLVVFLHQQVYRLFRNRNRSDGVLRLRPADHQLSVDATYLLCDGDRHS